MVDELNGYAGYDAKVICVLDLEDLEAMDKVTFVNQNQITKTITPGIENNLPVISWTTKDDVREEMGYEMAIEAI